MIYQGRASYAVQEAILHTSATPGCWHQGKTASQMRDEIHRWHRARGWRGIGYHRVIAPDGTIAVGRSLWEVGAHCKERNRGTVGICLIPVNDHRGIGQFQDYFTEAQRSSLRHYLAELGQMTDLKWVTGHNQYARKECPGFIVRSEDWLPAKRKIVA